ncbi:MAG TPA: hypothetical protein VMY38_07190 [Gemmatimonadaceae bacterium]|nr:hypothetical protein [Gemmatimonadaceae bacterium]
MRAHQDPIYGHSLAQAAVHFFDQIETRKPVADIRLVGHDDDEESGILEALHYRRGIRHQTQIAELSRRIRLSGDYQSATQHAVPVKKNSGA